MAYGSGKTRKQSKQSGAPDWLITFADLMSLLVCFFVLIISFSIQDKEKLQVVAGSMREAFGVRAEAKKSGLIEIEGSPVRDYVKQVSAEPQPNDTDFAEVEHDQARKQGPEANTHENERKMEDTLPSFAAAAASLRQALQEMPDVAKLADQVVLEETPEGLNIQLLDKEGRSMFPANSKFPYDHTRKVLAAIAPVLHGLPNRIAITGHTDSVPAYGDASYTAWELTADRANAARAILVDNGIPQDRFFAVAGKADTEPLFPDNTFLAANRRIEILLMSEAPPLPVGHKP